MKKLAVSFALLALGIIGSSRSKAAVLPILSLEKDGTTATSATITVNTPVFTIDAVLNSSGQQVEGIQYFLSVTSSGNVTYNSATPTLTALSPFTTSDISTSPAVNNPLDSTHNGTTAFFKSAAPDYGAINGAIASYPLNTSGLAVGTYTFTPNGVEFLNREGTDTTTFGTPGTFTLTVTPEPASISLFGLGTAGLLLARRRRNSTSPR